MKKVAVVLLGLVVLGGVGYGMYVGGGKLLQKHNQKIANIVMSNIAVNIMNELQQKGEITIIVRDKGKETKAVLVEKKAE